MEAPGLKFELYNYCAKRREPTVITYFAAATAARTKLIKRNEAEYYKISLLEPK